MRKLTLLTFIVVFLGSCSYDRMTIVQPATAQNIRDFAVLEVPDFDSTADLGYNEDILTKIPDKFIELAKKKKHPCMVPYSELPFGQRVKDSVFFGIAQQLLRAD